MRNNLHNLLMVVSIIISVISKRTLVIMKKMLWNMFVEDPNADTGRHSKIKKALYWVYKGEKEKAEGKTRFI